MARPATLSSTAVLVVTVSIRVATKYVVESVVKIVPRLVAMRAVAAAKAYRMPADTNFVKTKDNKIGDSVPVIIGDSEAERLVLKDLVKAITPPLQVRVMLCSRNTLRSYMHKPTCSIPNSPIAL
jgi:hypothetical protein